MKDLRSKIANLNIKPKQTKHNDFNLALADYLTKELKKRGITTSKLNDLAVRIHVGDVEKFKYHSLVVDCLDGNMYVVDKRNKERRVGKLIAFKGTRSSDAFHCLTRSIYKILKKLSIYTIEHELPQPIVRDLRTKKIVSDLRVNKVTVADLRKNKVTISDLRNKKVLDLRGVKKSPNKIESAILASRELKKAKEEVLYASDSNSFLDTAKNVIQSGINMFKRLLRK